MGNVANIQNKDVVNRYVLWLSSFSDDVKLGIIEGLSASMRRTKSKDDNSMDFMKELSGAWEEKSSVDDVMREIRCEDRSLLHRKLKTW